MTKLFLRIFVRDYKNTSDSRVRSRYGYLSAGLGIFFNLVLFVFKFIAGTLTGSIAVTADAFNNLSDMGGSAISLISFKIASRPADRDHPYGHARIEYISSLVVAFLILLVAFDLAKDSVSKIIEPIATKFDIVAVIILAVSIAVKLYMFIMNRKLGSMIDSEVLKATAADSISDAVSTSAVLVSSLLLKFTGLDIDAYMGLAVTVMILVTGIKLVKENMDSIMGAGPVDSEVSAIMEVVGQFPEVLGVHDLMVHNYGPLHTIASFHAEVDGSVDVYETHDTIDNLERAIKEKLGILCTVHMDPIVVGDELVDRLRADTVRAVTGIDDRFIIHDFRCVTGATHTNLIFDVAAPFEQKLTDTEIKDEIEHRIKKQMGQEYFTVVTVDRS